MSIGTIASIASSIWSAATTALSSPTPNTAPVSRPATKPNGPAAANDPTGSTNPFQALSPDLQAWLTQNQATSGAAQTVQSQPQEHHHHHHHAGGSNQSQQQDPFQAIQSYASTDALPNIGNAQSMAA